MKVTPWIGCAALIFAVACDKRGGGTTAPAGASGAEQPRVAESTYVSTANNDETEAKKKKVEPQTPDDGKLRDPEKVRAIAADAAGEVLDPYAPTLMTPAFVTAWPSTDSKVMYIVYPLTPTQGSVNTFKVGTPVKVKVSLLDGSTEVEKLPRSGRFKTFEEKRFPTTEQEELVVAERAVMGLVLGEREYATAHFELGSYAVWLFHYSKVASDLRARIPKVAAWHRKPHK